MGSTILIRGFQPAFIDMDGVLYPELLEKAFRALKSGGRIVVQAMFLHDDNSGPEWPALHNLLMLLIYRGGKAYSMAETIPWLEKTGFVDIERVPMSFYNVSSLLVARKP